MKARAPQLVLVLLLLLVLGRARSATAMPDFDGGAQLHYELEGMHDVKDDAVGDATGTMDVPGARNTLLAGARLHGFIGGRTFGLHVGLDLAAGGTIDRGGFAYDVALFPLGLAVRFAETSFLTLGIGVGASGATRVLDDAATMPVEARFELGRGIRVLGRARAVFLSGADSRQDGARFADELEAMLAVRLGSGYDDWGFPTGNGYFSGASYREAMGAQFAGIVVGYSIDMGTRRRPRDYSSSSRCPECE